MQINTYHRHIACELAANLPEHRDDALAVLAAMRILVDGFLAEPAMGAEKGDVITFKHGSERVVPLR